MLQINFVLLALVVGAVHSIHDPAYTGIKTKAYRRDPQIAQALHYQQQQQQQQQQHDHFTANKNQHAANYQQRPTKTRINSGDSERLSATIDNNHIHAPQQASTQQHYHREQPIYERQFHERHAAIASAPLRSSSNWDDSEQVINDVYTGCPAQFTGQLPYTYDCRRFLNCWNGRGHIQSCAPGTVFNPDTLECDRPDKVVCGAVGSVRSPQNRPTNANYRAGRLLDAKVEHVPQLCPPGVTGLHPHPTDCTKFLNCANGNVHVQDCGPGTAYSITLMVCDFKHKVDCSGREGDTDDIGVAETRQPTYVTNALDDANENDGIFCPNGVSGHFPHPFDYSKFMHCNHGKTAIQNCVPGTMFSISKRFCDALNEIDPRDHVSNTIRDKNYPYSTTVVRCPPGMHGEYLYPYDCSKYITCMPDQKIAIQSCAAGMIYSHSRSECLPERDVQTYDRVGYAAVLERDNRQSGVHGATSPGGNSIVVNCPSRGTGVYPYPFDCGKYLLCQNGQITVELCSPGKVFSLSSKRCELKDRVDATERVAFSSNEDYSQRELFKKNKDSDNLSCPAGMDGLFLHPFDCSAYLRCSHGIRSIEYCPAGTIFSITRQQCVPNNEVKNFDRVDYFEDNHNLSHKLSNTEWTQNPLYKDYDNVGNNDIDNVICPPGANGVFPHPFDCQKYLNCVSGRTRIESCQQGKAWDVAMEVCIVQHQVDCGTRTESKKLGSSADFSLINELLPPLYAETVACKPGVKGLFAHPFDCTKFLNCQNGRTIIQNCIAGSVFSISKKYCELKEHIGASDRVPFVHEYGHELMEETEGGDFQKTMFNPNQISCPPGATGKHLHPFEAHKYVKCDGDRMVIYVCPTGMLYQLVSKECVPESQVDYNFVPTLENYPEWGDLNSPIPLNSNLNPMVQCPHGASGMFPHPNDCSKFLNCVNGVTHIQECAPGTAWSMDMEICDFEQNVNCASRPILSEGSMRSGSLSNERVECQKGSSGLQPHPYDCNKFLNCANGITHVQSCGPGTAWNRTMEVCDFVANVECSLQSNMNLTYVRPTKTHTQTNTDISDNGRGSKPYQPGHWNVPATDPNGRTYQPRIQPIGPAQPGLVNRTPHTFQTTPSTSHQQPQHFSGYDHRPNSADSEPPTTYQYGRQPSYNDRWTNMQRPRPIAPPTNATQPHYHTNSEDKGQQPISTDWNIPQRRPYSNVPADWSGSGSSTQQQSPGQAVLYEEGSLQPNRNYSPNVRKYSTPLAPFAPITSTTTPIPFTNIYYAQPVGSQEDSREVFDNISGGDLGPTKPSSPTYINPIRPKILVPTSGVLGYDSLPSPNQTPFYSTTPQSNPQHEPINPRYDSNDRFPEAKNTPSNRLFPVQPVDSGQYPEREPRTFNDTRIVLENMPGAVDPFQRSPYERTPDLIDQSNLYGGLQPPTTTPTYVPAAPTTYLSPPSGPTTPVRKTTETNEPETQARVYQIYHHIQNAREQNFSRDPHYSRSYSGVAHSRNASWANDGIKSHHPSTQKYPPTTSQTIPLLQKNENDVPATGNYNRQYYNPSQIRQNNDEPNPSDPMQQLPISDALRMLLRPYYNRSGTISEDDAVMAESHIMNLAAAASVPSTNSHNTQFTTTTTSTTIRPRTHTAEHEDDVELIFTDEQHSLVSVPTSNGTSTTSSESHTSPHTNSRYHPQYHANRREPTESERSTNWHNHDFHQRHPHLPNPFYAGERSSSPPTQNINWPHHRHHHHSHNRNFHKNHPNLPNPFETTRIQSREQAELTTPPSNDKNINVRFGSNDAECQFSCGNGKCVKNFEVCDGVNNCGNRKDENQCDHLGYEVRLRGGESTNMGRIEIKILGKWGYVCDDKFGLRDADVVCKELGFKLGASEVRGNSFYPPTESNISFVMDEVDCIGNETSLRQCAFKGWGVNNCGPDEVVGVVCKVPQLKCPNNYWLCSTSKECIPPAFVCDNTPDCADQSDESERVCNSPIEYRLEGGRSSNIGRVEVMYRGEWGTVCDDDFGLNEAQVLCNSLGFYGTPKIEKNIFGPGSGPIWLDQVSCFGNETSIDKCNHWTWGEHNCNHTEDVGVRCTAGPAPRRTTSDSSIKGSSSNVETQHSLEDSSSLEDIGLYGGQVQRSSKFLNVNNQKRCGQFKQNLIDEYEHPEERVINGTMAKRGQHPWQATIRTKGRGGISSHWCGAVLISKRHLLTAAHCLVGYPKGAYFIRMGDHYTNIAEASEIDSYIENWYIHEKFRDKTHMNNDIALIVLKNPVRFNDYIQPICLPDKDAPLQVNRMCTISGWGSIKSGVSTPSNILRAAQLPILSDETCKQAHVYGTSMTEGMFCAGSMDESVDACDGDSGGPLVCSDDDGETLYGIISWGQQCGFANKPGVYVRIGKYIDWIYEKINFSMQQTSN